MVVLGYAKNTILKARLMIFLSVVVPLYNYITFSSNSRKLISPCLVCLVNIDTGVLGLRKVPSNIRNPTQTPHLILVGICLGGELF